MALSADSGKRRWDHQRASPGLSACELGVPGKKPDHQRTCRSGSDRRGKEKKRLTLDLENLQKSLLEKGVEEQLEKNIPESLKKKGIEVTACKVHIEGELLKVCLWTKEVPDGELERGIKDELAANWGIREENCEVLAWENGKQTMGDSSPFGTSAYGNCTSGIR